MCDIIFQNRIISTEIYTMIPVGIESIGEWKYFHVRYSNKTFCCRVPKLLGATDSKHFPAGNRTTSVSLTGNAIRDADLYILSSVHVISAMENASRNCGICCRFYIPRPDSLFSYGLISISLLIPNGCESSVFPSAFARTHRQLPYHSCNTALIINYKELWIWWKIWTGSVFTLAFGFK